MDDDFTYPDPEDFSGNLEERFEDYMSFYGDDSPYEWDNFQDFLNDLHDDEVDHSPDSDLAHFLEDVGLRDEDAEYDVGDTPGSE